MAYLDPAFAELTEQYDRYERKALSRLLAKLTSAQASAVAACSGPPRRSRSPQRRDLDGAPPRRGPWGEGGHRRDGLSLFGRPAGIAPEERSAEQRSEYGDHGTSPRESEGAARRGSAPSALERKASFRV